MELITQVAVVVVEYGVQVMVVLEVLVLYIRWLT
jgi:hypothetical protein